VDAEIAPALPVITRFGPRYMNKFGREAFRMKSKPTNFVVISNTRCGSTWLATALAHSSPLVFVDREVKIEDYRSSPVHAPIGAANPAEDLMNILDSLFDGHQLSPRLVGTKITLDAAIEPHHGSTASQRLEKLVALRMAFPQLKVIHLTRHYCEQYESRGGVTLSPDQSQLRREVAQSTFVTTGQETPFIASDTTGPATSHRCAPLPVLHRLINDLCVATVFSSSADFLNVEYEHVHRDWDVLLTFLGIETNRTLSESSVIQRNSRSEPEARCSLGAGLSKLRDDLLLLETTPNLHIPLDENLVPFGGELLDNLHEELRHAAQDPTEVRGSVLLASLWSRLMKRIRIKAS